MERRCRGLRHIAAFALLLFVLGLLAGCGRLRSTQEVETGIRQALPDAEILNVKTGMRSEKHKMKSYTIDNKGVVFTYTNYQRTDTLFGGTTASSENDYCQKLFEHFSEEIHRIAEKYQVEIEIVSGSFARIVNDVTTVEEIDAGVDAMEEICMLIKDYMPEEKLNWFPFEIGLMTRYGKNWQFIMEKQGDWNESYYRKLLYLNFKADAEEGLTDGVSAPQEWLESIPQKYIRNLYINGEPYRSEDYEIRFLYNVEDGKYYTPVGFGVKLDYNGGVEDYLQREIIERYYPDSEYTISEKEKATSYKIGGDHYEVKRQEEGLIFLKNGVNLQIANKNEISHTHTGATYYYWISVEDFAALLGMSVEKIEESGVYLSLP